MKTDQQSILVRRSGERGRVQHGWLDTRHTFSFATYMDPEHMGFRSLRVINEDIVAPGAGFPTHPHRDMEIFSYVVGGAIEHKDSMGNGRVLKPGEIQLMSAGSGVTHSEFNPSREEALHLLQIWIHPHTNGLEPTYTEWHPGEESENQKKTLVISPDGSEGSAVIRQDANVFRIRLNAGEEVGHNLADGRGLWLQVIEGPVELNGVRLEGGDGASSGEASTFVIKAADGPAEALLFDLA